MQGSTGEKTAEASIKKQVLKYEKLTEVPTEKEQQNMLTSKTALQKAKAATGDVRETYSTLSLTFEYSMSSFDFELWAFLILQAKH